MLSNYRPDSSPHPQQDKRQTEGDERHDEGKKGLPGSPCCFDLAFLSRQAHLKQGELNL